MGYLELDGFRLHYRVDGAIGAPTVLLSNSLGTDMHLWDQQLPILSSHFRVVRYDSRGHGASEAPPGPYTIEALAGDALALLDLLEIERAHICGVSLGGMLGLWLAAHRPERVNRAVCTSTAAKIGTSELWQARIESVRAEGMAAVCPTHVSRFLRAAFRSEHPELTRQISRTCESTSPVGYIGSCLALRDADLRPIVRSIPRPMLLVAGAQDVATPPADVQWLHAQISRSELIRLDHAAHLANVEDPERFTQSVLAFLSRTSDA